MHSDRMGEIPVTRPNRWVERIAAKAVAGTINVEVEEKLYDAVREFALKYQLTFSEAVKIMYESLS